MQKIVCGMCSFGMSGRIFHGPLLKAHREFSLSAVLERNNTYTLEQFPEARICKSLPELLQVPEIDLIIVNVPDHLHTSFCKAALEAGKHVVVEKPVTLTVSEGQMLIDLAAKQDLGLFVFQNRRWDSDFLTVKGIIESGQLGRVVEYEAHYDRYRPEPPANTWKEDGKLGPGLLYNLGAHLIDQALVLFGWPKEVYADIKKLRKDTRIIDFDIKLYYTDGLTVILKSSYLVRKATAKYIIHGEKGSFIKSGTDPQEERLKLGWDAGHPEIGLEPEEDWGTIFTDNKDLDGKIVKSIPGSYLKFYDGVFDELSGKENSAVSGAEGLKVIIIIEAAYQSHKSGSKISISN